MEYWKLVLILVTLLAAADAAGGGQIMLETALLIQVDGEDRDII
jgi:hypothetical protein